MQSGEYDDPVTIYRRELAKIQPMTSDEQAKLFQRLGGSDKWNDQQEDVARRIIESQLAQVVSIAEKYSSHGVPMLDLIQEGNIGLFRAVEKFAKQPSGDFPTYASGVIKDAITSFVNRPK